MRIRTAISKNGGAKAGLAEILTQLDVARHGHPDFIALHFGNLTSANDLQSEAAAHLQGTAIHGGTSCLGAMTESGVQITTGAAIGAFAVWDAGGGFGTSSSELGTDAHAAARQATIDALTAADRDGEIPDLVWLTVSPGREEQVLAGIRSVVGATTLIVGGSAADNDVTGKWAQFGPKAVHGDGVVVSVLFPSTPISSAYQSGYAPTGDSGVVTRVSGRRLFEIDGKPAAAVYERWTNGAVSGAGAEPVSILAAATLWPLGRVTRHVAGVPFHLLAHPAAANPDGSIDLFADIAEGDRLWQMQGSVDSLIARAGRVAHQACAENARPVAGALVVYCGGCMLAVRERMQEVAAGITAQMGDAPWLGLFTFGEQGIPAGDEAKHGNLMISCTTFSG